MIADLDICNKYLDELINHPVSEDEVRGGRCFYKWNENLPYDRSYEISIEKNPDKDFVILNLSDIQCHDGEAFSQVGEFYEETIDKLIKKVSPDLITLTGDNAFDSFAHLKLIDFLESYAIPWAPVMGNADHTGCVSEFWLAYRLSRAKHCLFDFGPEGHGFGNYIINIRENGKAIHTLFMMDTHHEEEMMKGSYDHLTAEQIRWYEWAVRGIAQAEGKTVPSTAVMHIPVPEIQDAWDSVFDYEKQELTGRYKDEPFCKMHEKNGAPLFNNGFFEKACGLGSTVNMMFGHDHINCFCIEYKGINLIYAMKTGYGCYWENETNGGTTITVGSDGKTRVSHNYINPEKSKVKKFMLDYYNVNLYKPHED